MDEDRLLGATGSSRKKPDLGCKLNVPSTITLNTVSPPKDKTPAEFERLLRKALEKQSTQNAEKVDDFAKAEFLNYDHVTMEWKFRVPHWTKWGSVIDEDDTDDNDAPAKAASNNVIANSSDPFKKHVEVVNMK